MPIEGLILLWHAKAAAEAEIGAGEEVADAAPGQHLRQRPTVAVLVIHERRIDRHPPGLAQVSGRVGQAVGLFRAECSRLDHVVAGQADAPLAHQGKQPLPLPRIGRLLEPLLHRPTRLHHPAELRVLLAEPDDGIEVLLVELRFIVHGQEPAAIPVGRWHDINGLDPGLLEGVPRRALGTRRRSGHRSRQRGHGDQHGQT